MITINKAYKYELEPNVKQSELLVQHAGNTRFVWNQLVDIYYFHKDENKYICTVSDLQKEIHDLKEEFEFLEKSHSQALQFPAHNLAKAIKKANSESTVKERKKAIAKAIEETDEELKKRKLAKAYNLGYPKHKKKSACNDSIYMPQGFKLRRSRIWVPKIGWIHYHKHVQYEGKYKTATIVLEGDKWYLCLCCEVEIPRENLEFADANKDKLEAQDLGLKKFATATDGKSVANPKPLKKKQKHLRTAGKKLSRKYQNHKKGDEFSNNYKKQSQIVATIHRKVKNSRNDFLMKTANHTITTCDISGIVMEDLYIKGMLKNKR